MKKYVYLILALSITGAVLSGLLLLQHYYPDARIGIISCGDGLINPCLTLSQSPWSALFRIPIAAYGLFWFLLAMFIVLIADYAGGRYHAWCLAVILPLAAFSVAADAVLAVILIATKLFCKFCIASYAVNIGILAVAVLWFLKARRDEQFSLPGALREIVSSKDAPPDRKAFQSAFVLFLFLLCFALFSTSYILSLKTGNRRVPADKVNSFLTNFYQQPARKIEFPDTGILLGSPDAKVTLYVFTDFLCSACYEFYKIEQYLFGKYGDSVRTVYYNFPLDQGCNRDLKHTVYKNSCIAARAFSAASDAGFTDEYTIKHFADYENTHRRYDMNLAIAAFRLMSPADRRGVDEARFRLLMNSDATTRRIEEHIRLGKELGVDSTPTIFIGGRKLVGFPPLEIMDQMVKNELRGNRGSE
jgi:protein-disulfide isomerase/uncharacterized membrane protein